MDIYSIDYLKSLARELDVEHIANHVLCMTKFPIWSGSAQPNSHHYGKGGLLKHTAEVIHLSLLNNLYFGENQPEKVVDRKILYLAGLFHDTGKIWDYEPTTPDYVNWQCAPHKKRIHHISRSALVWHDAAIAEKVHTKLHDDVLHCILAHHGQRAWGSPVEPIDRAAWLLHLSDMISARMDDCLRRNHAR
jgi:3'-5' exoribonuclease